MKALRLLVAAWICALALPAFAAPYMLIKPGQTEVGSGNAVVVGSQVMLSGGKSVDGEMISEDREIEADFAGLIVEAPVEVVYRVTSGKRMAKITAPKEAQDALVLISDGRVLTLKLSRGVALPRKAKIELQGPKIATAAVVGVASVNVNGVSGKSFKAVVKGPGLLVVKGAVSAVEASLTGAGTLDLSGLKADTSTAKLAGQGTIKTFATQAVLADAQGGGNILIEGDPPKTDVSVAGTTYVSAAKP